MVQSITKKKTHNSRASSKRIDSEVVVFKAADGRVKLGGWLVAYLISLGLGGLSNMQGFLVSLNNLQAVNTQKALYQSTYPGYMGLVWYELLSYGLLVLTAIAVVVLFYKNYKFAKSLAIAFLIGCVVLNVGHMLLVQSVFAGHGDTNAVSSDIQPVFQSIIIAVIWVPYLLLSTRVKKTLHKDMPTSDW